MTQPPSVPQGSQPSPSRSARVEMMEYRGPVPPPADLEHYERIVKGAGDRIITMAEKQASHRQTIERRVINTNNIASVLGQVFALLIALRAFQFSAEALKQGHSAAAITTVISTIASLVGIFLYGRRKAAQERHRRADS